MAHLNLFIEEKILNDKIKDLEQKRSNLRNTINEEIKVAIKKFFPSDDCDSIYESHSKEIEEMKGSLYSDYEKKINSMLSGLEDIKNELRVSSES